MKHAGGGGMGEVGYNGGTDSGAWTSPMSVGGDGLYYGDVFSGATVYGDVGYFSGGGNGNYNGIPYALEHSLGGGGWGPHDGSATNAGTPNTGGGGCGEGATQVGGSGMVLIKYTI